MEMEYVILLGTDPSSLTSLVNARLRDGWRPQGGLAVMTVREAETQEDAEQWAQAMIREDEAQASHVTQSEQLPASTMRETPHRSAHVVRTPLHVAGRCCRQ